MAQIEADDLITGDASIEEIALFRSIAAKWLPFPEGIRRVRFDFKDASDGTPSVWITAIVADEDALTDENVRKLVTETERFRRDVIDAGSERWPYTSVATDRT